MEAIKDFLGKNGFVFSTLHESWLSDKCEVKINIDHYSVLSYNEEFGDDGDMIGFMYSRDLNIYWLIGVLTYYNLIDKNYS